MGARILRLVEAHLGDWSMQLCWTAPALSAWEESGLAFEKIDSHDAHTTAYCLALMAREGKSICRTYGYDLPDAPSCEEVEQYLKDPLCMAYEMLETTAAIVECLMVGGHREFNKNDISANVTCISDQELKKN